MRKKIDNTRNNFIKMRGGRLISIESVILAIIVFTALMIRENASLYISFATAFVVGFVFPIFVGIFKSFAWVAAVLFSLAWAFLGLAFVATIAGGLAGLVTGIIVFVISFMTHKNYAGITIRGISRKRTNHIDVVNVNSYIAKENVRFCPNCGRRITLVNGVCDVCNK